MQSLLQQLQMDNARLVKLLAVTDEYKSQRADTRNCSSTSGNAGGLGAAAALLALVGLARRRRS